MCTESQGSRRCSNSHSCSCWHTDATMSRPVQGFQERRFCSTKDSDLSAFQRRHIAHQRLVILITRCFLELSRKPFLKLTRWVGTVMPGNPKVLYNDWCSFEDAMRSPSKYGMFTSESKVWHVLTEKSIFFLQVLSFWFKSFIHVFGF